MPSKLLVSIETKPQIFLLPMMQCNLLLFPLLTFRYGHPKWIKCFRKGRGNWEFGIRLKPTNIWQGSLFNYQLKPPSRRQHEEKMYSFTLTRDLSRWNLLQPHWFELPVLFWHSGVSPCSFFSMILLAMCLAGKCLTSVWKSFSLIGGVQGCLWRR